MKTEVRKRLDTCLLLWAAFVGIKWVMLLGPSSILAKLSPLMVIFQDADKDYAVSGWTALGIETVLTGAFFLIRMRKISVLYILCAVYSLTYVPTLVYWVATLEFEVWRYLQFVPAVVCCAFMLIGLRDYIKQEKLVRPTSKPPKKKTVSEKKENE